MFLCYLLKRKNLIPKKSVHPNVFPGVFFTKIYGSSYDHLSWGSCCQKENIPELKNGKIMALYLFLWHKKISQAICFNQNVLYVVLPLICLISVHVFMLIVRLLMSKNIAILIIRHRCHLSIHFSDFSTADWCGLNYFYVRNSSICEL